MIVRYFIFVTSHIFLVLPSLLDRLFSNVWSSFKKYTCSNQNLEQMCDFAHISRMISFFCYSFCYKKPFTVNRVLKLLLSQMNLGWFLGSIKFNIACEVISWESVDKRIYCLFTLTVQRQNIDSSGGVYSSSQFIHC